MRDKYERGRAEKRHYPFIGWSGVGEANIQGDPSAGVLYFVSLNLGSSPAYGLLLQLANAQAGQGKFPFLLQQNIGLKLTGHPAEQLEREPGTQCGCGGATCLDSV